jgi:prepilin-type N-terminal cleavage/methylation domain-containing protein
VKRGYSLVELVVVIAIMAILLMIALPSFKKWKASIALKNFVYNLSSRINEARYYSRAKGERVILAVVSKGSEKNLPGLPSGIGPVIYFFYVDKNKNFEFDSGDEPLWFGAEKVIVEENQLPRKCFSREARCLVIYPVGPPAIGAAPRYLKFSHTEYPDIEYTLKFRSITGITEVSH